MMYHNVSNNLQIHYELEICTDRFGGSIDLYGGSNHYFPAGRHWQKHRRL